MNKYIIKVLHRTSKCATAILSRSQTHSNVIGTFGIGMAKGGFHKYYTSGQQNLRVLIDMDQVLCDFESHFLEEFKRKFPDEPTIPLDKREGFYIADQYDKMKPGLSVKCAKVYNSKGFFHNIPEIEGSVAAAKEIWNMERVDAFICTSPVKKYKYCLREKFHWVEEHLGKEWLDRILLVKDKTMANGHVLIDDKVDVTGANPYPSWDHVVFSSYHSRNLDLRGRRVLNNWTDGSWRVLIQDCMKKI